MMRNPESPAAADRQGLPAAFRAVRDALLAGDMEALQDLYAEDFRSHSVRGDVEGRAAVLDAEFRHRVRFVDIFLRRDGRWRYYFSQSTEIVPDMNSGDV